MLKESSEFQAQFLRLMNRVLRARQRNGLYFWVPRSATGAVSEEEDALSPVTAVQQARFVQHDGSQQPPV
jgi:hypothetical protein